MSTVRSTHTRWLNGAPQRIGGWERPMPDNEAGPIGGFIYHGIVETPLLWKLPDTEAVRSAMRVLLDPTSSTAACEDACHVLNEAADEVENGAAP